MADDGVDKSFKKTSEAFKELSVDVEVVPFSRACSLTSPLFGSLGIAFKFAEMDYVAKALLNHDIEENTVKKAGNHLRNLLSIKRGLDMVRVLFEQILVLDGNSLRDPASKDYADVFAPYHGWAIRKAVGAGMYALPTKAHRLKKLNINEACRRLTWRITLSLRVPSLSALINSFYQDNWV